MRIAVTTVLAAACLALPASAHAAGYTYTTIANGSETRFLGSCPAINLRGQVAFTASDFDPETFDVNDSMLRGSGGALTTIAGEESDGLVAIVGNPSINIVGQVAFDANPDDDDREVILRGSGGPLTEIARASEARRFDSFTADVSLNSLGRVAFGAELNAGGDEGVFEGSGGPVATRYVASTSRFAGSAGQPSLTEVESVAFTEETDDGGAGVFRQDILGRITQIASGFFSGRVSLNLAGRVAYSSFDAVYVNGVADREHRRRVLRLRLLRPEPQRPQPGRVPGHPRRLLLQRRVHRPERDARRGRPHGHRDRRAHRPVGERVPRDAQRRGAGRGHRHLRRRDTGGHPRHAAPVALRSRSSCGGLP